MSGSSATLTPPFRFALLAASIRPSDPPASVYRGSLPKHHNLAFLATLNLKTIVSVTPKPIDVYEVEAAALLDEKERAAEVEGRPSKRRRATSEVDFNDWAAREGISVIHVKVGAGKPKDGHIPFDTATVKTVLELMVSRVNLPMYIHDLDGSDVLSIMGAALRKLQGWPEDAYTAEMSRFLRAPPPAPEHRTFLSRLFSSTPHASDDATQALQIPPPSLRAPWLWTSGIPTAPAHQLKKGLSNASPGASGDPVHATMRCRIARDPEDATTGVGTGYGRDGSIRNGEERSRPDLARVDSDSQSTLRGVSIGRTGSATSLELEARSRNSSLGGARDRGEHETAADRRSQLDDGEEEDGEEEDDEDEEEEDEVPVSRMIDALDIGV